MDTQVHNMHQNCDATTHVLTTTVVTELQVNVPVSNATQLYIQAAVWTHCLYCNEKYGSPPITVRSLWAGLMTHGGIGESTST